MARPIRIEYPGAWYHITCRGNEHRLIFKDNQDREKFLEILSTSIASYNVELHAYVLMNNHFHLVVKTLDANLQKFMQRFNTTYTVYFNRKWKRSGHLYQGRYKAILVDIDNYLLELSRYVHLNPIRIKKYSNRSLQEKLQILKGYCWSSLPGYINIRRRHSFITYNMVLEIFCGNDDRRGCKAYEQFIVDGIAKEVDNSFWKDIRGQAVLGSDSFVDYIHELYLMKRKVDKREQPGLEELSKAPNSIEEIAYKVAKIFNVSDETALYQRGSRERQARSIFIELCRRYLSSKISLSELGRRLGNISGAAISMNMKRLNEAMKNEKSLRLKFQMLEKDI